MSVRLQGRRGAGAGRGEDAAVDRCRCSGSEGRRPVRERLELGSPGAASRSARPVGSYDGSRELRAVGQRREGSGSGVHFAAADSEPRCRGLVLAQLCLAARLLSVRGSALMKVTAAGPWSSAVLGGGRAEGLNASREFLVLLSEISEAHLRTSQNGDFFTGNKNTGRVLGGRNKKQQTL